MAKVIISKISLGSLTQGSIPFVNADGKFAEDNDDLFWDSTNKRLGIGLDGGTPEYTLHVGGDGAGAKFESQNGIGFLTWDPTGEGNYGQLKLSGSYTTLYLESNATIKSNTYVGLRSWTGSVRLGSWTEYFLTVDNSSTSGETRLLIYDVDSGQLERVYSGANDSAWTGKRLLAINNS